MARKTWDSLTPAYRSRLERGGISKTAYQSGASLSAARGHARTPERPSQAERNPERYPEYREKRQDLVTEILNRKADWYSGRPLWNRAAARQHVRVNANTGKVRGPGELREILRQLRNWDDNEAPDWENLTGGTSDEFAAALYYHKS